MADTSGILVNYREAYASIQEETLSTLESQYDILNLKGDEKAKLLANVIANMQQTALQIAERSLLIAKDIEKANAEISFTLAKANDISVTAIRNDNLATADINLKSSQQELYDAQKNDIAKTATRNDNLATADISLKGAQEELYDAQKEDIAKTAIRNDSLATADINLKSSQEELYDAQKSTESYKQSDLSASAILKGKQGYLIDEQKDTETYKQSDLNASSVLKGKQGLLVDEQKDTEKVKQRDLLAGANLKAQQRDKVRYESALTDRQTVAFNDKLRIEEAKHIANAIGMAPDYVKDAGSSTSSAYNTLISKIDAITPYSAYTSGLPSEKNAPTA